MSCVKFNDSCWTRCRNPFLTLTNSAHFDRIMCVYANMSYDIIVSHMWPCECSVTQSRLLRRDEQRKKNDEQERLRIFEPRKYDCALVWWWGTTTMGLFVQLYEICGNLYSTPSECFRKRIRNLFDYAFSCFFFCGKNKKGMYNHLEAWCLLCFVREFA